MKRIQEAKAKNTVVRALARRFKAIEKRVTKRILEWSRSGATVEPQFTDEEQMVLNARAGLN